MLLSRRVSGGLGVLLSALVVCLVFGATTALAAGPGTLVDAGFESRTDATALDASVWTLFGAPGKAEYDTLRAKNGTLSRLDTGLCRHRLHRRHRDQDRRDVF